jgi:NAD(P)-dependent dehydrogenase (short-subunit alcohol dehydrogenase family)
LAVSIFSSTLGRLGSIAAPIGGTMGGLHYAASKGGVNALARALARRMGQHQVTVNSAQICRRRSSRRSPGGVAKARQAQASVDD